MPNATSLAGLARTLYGGGALFLAIHLLGSTISFGVHLFAARVLGAASYGWYVYAMSCVAILVLGCDVGLRHTVVRFAAAYAAHHDGPRLRGLVRHATRWTLGASALTLAGSIVAGAWWRPRLDELGLTLLLAAAAMPLVALSEVWSAVVRGLGAVARSQWPASVVQHLGVAVTLAAIVWTAGPAGGAPAAGAAFLAGALGSLAAAGTFLRATLPDYARDARPAGEPRQWAGVAGTNLLIALFQAVRVPAIVVIAGAYVESQQLAYYGAAQRLAGIASMGLLGLSGFAAPMLARAHALGDVAGLRRIAMLSAAAALATAMPPTLVLLAFGDPLLGLFGPGFESARATLAVLLAGELAGAACGPVGFYLTMSGRQWIATLVEALSSIGVVTLGIVLIPSHGITGAAQAVALGALLRNGAMAAIMVRSLRANAGAR